MGRVLHRLPQAHEGPQPLFPSVARRIREDAFAKAEAEAALRLGLDIDGWDALDDHQRAFALAPALVDAEREAAKCPACGGPASDCQDPDNQHAYVVTMKRCYRTRALLEAQARRKSDNEGVLWVVNLDPSRKKSATQKGATARG